MGVSLLYFQLTYLLIPSIYLASDFNPKKRRIDKLKQTKKELQQSYASLPFSLSLPRSLVLSRHLSIYPLHPTANAT
jgi:hypothetical protein